MGSQHPSPNVKTLCTFEPQIWPEVISHHVMPKVLTCFKGSRASCDVIIFGIFGPNFGKKISHHVMDASCDVRTLYAHIMHYTSYSMSKMKSVSVVENLILSKILKTYVWSNSTGRHYLKYCWECHSSRNCYRINLLGPKLLQN